MSKGYLKSKPFNNMLGAMLKKPKTPMTNKQKIAKLEKESDEKLAELRIVW